ncbi:unnamed protein product [Paramecium sonneborni]|uniref:RNA-dependent RNA polymerase n=1 Tax=Paramecium sonneborni TaxID=65129 RepID=A0A8S1RS65_9CILI|nr:unnamed protein product [Paramecium sonneborni]
MDVEFEEVEDNQQINYRGCQRIVSQVFYRNLKYYDGKKDDENRRGGVLEMAFSLFSRQTSLLAPSGYLYPIKLPRGNKLQQAIQIRFHESKGVLLLNDNLSVIAIGLRTSMVKFNPNLMNDVKYSKLSYLIIINLEVDILIDKQQYYYQQYQVQMMMQQIFGKDLEHVCKSFSNIQTLFSRMHGELQVLPSIIDNIRLIINQNLDQNNNIYINKYQIDLKEEVLFNQERNAIFKQIVTRVLGIIDHNDLLIEGEKVRALS